jgi:hypothetical protein
MSIGVLYPLGMGFFSGVAGEMLYFDWVEAGFDKVVEVVMEGGGAV